MEDASVHASQTHISCTIPSKPYTRTAFVAGRAVRLAIRTRRRHPSMAPRLGRISPPRERQATFLSDDSSDKRLVQLHDRLPRGSVAAWRRSRLRNVVHDRRGAVEHKHTYIHVLTLWARDQWRPFRLFHSSSSLGTRQV